MDKVREFLKGKKTYILATGGGLATALYFAQILDRDTYLMLLGFLGFGTTASIGAKVDRAAKR